MSNGKYYAKFKGVQDGVARFLFFVGDQPKSTFLRSEEEISDNIESGSFVHADLEADDGSSIDFEPAAFDESQVVLRGPAPEKTAEMKDRHEEARDHHEKAKEISRKQKEAGEKGPWSADSPGDRDAEE
ncbi:hypothetical protein [Natrinema altunense]|uniref:Uncharacterized protein n=1 Tax=Natrinema altunense TaxID=222984 RepID=A0A482XZQ3_9EURY|nr:hypothetical protein [Natrinema altunense]RZH69279.1 hypothetical protein ELS17_07580 [Natrinema altunense]